MPSIDNSGAGGTYNAFSDSFQGNGLFAQTFTVPNDPAYGALTALTFYYDHLSGGTLDFTVVIAKAIEDPNGGFVLGGRIFDTGTLFLTPDNDDQLAAFNVALGNLQLVAGQQYVFVLNAGPRRSDGGAYTIGSNTAYAGGQFFEGGGGLYTSQFLNPNGFMDLRFTLDFVAANSLPVANDDTNSASESGSTSGSLFVGSDSDAEGDPFTVTQINGSSAAVGTTFQLPSGALLTTTPYGTYSYNPNGAFNSLVSPSTGAANATATDTFTYAITGGDTAIVTITIVGENDAGDRLIGTSGDDTITGTANGEVFDLRQGGNDIANGGGGIDSFYFGGAFTAADYVDGGDNRDALILQGDYSGGLTFGTGTTSNIVNIESVSLLSGANTAFGDTANNRYSYNLTLLDANVAAGALMKVNAFFLLAGENLTVNGSAETDAPLQILAGQGIDHLIGGALGDAFVFGHDGRFGAGDTVDGGAGYDVFYLRGDYVIDFNAAGYAGALTNIESIALLTSQNTELAGGGDGEFDYSITWNDAMLAAGATMTVNGSRLGANESFVFNGASESNGNLRVFGGAAGDTLTTGGGDDILYGGGGADMLTSGAGADIFRYQSVSDSTPGTGTFDTINKFATGVDKIDLSRIDANPYLEGDQAFRFIQASFSGQGEGSAGELRVLTIIPQGVFALEADLDGNGTADFYIYVYDAAAVTSGDIIY